MRTDRGPRLARAISLAALFGGLLGGAVAPASAHDFDESHRAIVTVRAAPRTLTAEVILLMEIPKGQRASRLMLRFDFDRDDHLGRGEAYLLANHLGAEAVGGYVLRGDGRPLRPKEIKSSAALTKEGGITVAVLLEYTLDRPGVPTKVGVDVLVTPGGGAPLRARPITVELQVVGAVARVSSHPMAADAQVVGPVEIVPGGPGVWVELPARAAME